MNSNIPLVPVTIVTGFLGSGKSTLLNQILKRNQNKKIAVLVNEFGPTMEIEKLSITNDDTISTEDWIELENGCICCTVKDSAVIQLERLLQVKGPFDRVVIEASGVADPAKLYNMFWLDDAIQDKIKLDGILCVVDSFNFNLDSIPPEFFAQLALANVVLLNKIDLLKEKESTISSIKQFIQNINFSCKVLETNYCNFDFEEQIFNCGGIVNSSNVSVELDKEFHSRMYDKYCISFGKIAIQKDKLEFFIQNLLWERKIGEREFPAMILLRIKGLIKDLDGTIYLIHAVKEIYQFTIINPTSPIEEFKIVFIGQNIPSEIKSFDF